MKYLTNLKTGSAILRAGMICIKKPPWNFKEEGDVIHRGLNEIFP